MKISQVQQRIDNQRIKDRQMKIQRDHLEYVKKANQKRTEHPSKGKRIDVYV